MSRGKIAGIVVLGLVLAGGYWGYSYYEKIKPFQEFSNPENLLANFRSASETFPTYTLEVPEDTLAFDRRSDITIPETYVYKGETRSLSELLERTYTTGFMVAVDDTIISEDYYLGEQASDRHIMFSVSKSVVSAALGIALSEGAFDSIEDPITKYLPELNGSGYEGVRIKDILQMSSGVYFNEDYNDPFSDVNQMGLTIATGGSLNSFATGLERQWEPGTYNNYVSVDTHVLGMLLVKQTGKTLSEYVEEKIWQPMGAEFDGKWLTDGVGMEMAMGGFNMALRDMARVGRLYLHLGELNGKRIVPAEWVTASITPDAPHLMPGSANSSNPMGYGYQWWIPEDPHGDFYAAGIYYQYIYIDPTTGVIVAKTSADKKFTDPNEPRKKSEQVAAFQAISAHVAAQMKSLAMETEVREGGN
ncbi:MAG: serine hydrolase [Kordiimonadaceae bacterium]|nr:serine hydrolase [Kordiimonadaceae bacterium]MBO6569659.1 serine hydrolase [Kordiimonadaceae bacterium]MBO6966194.1 serine hydrolase [Kordiimonadaceae bacterium]